MILKYILPALIFLFILPPPSIASGAADTVDAPTPTKEWQKLGYDDLCTYVYPRPSATYLPSDTPYKPLWRILAPDTPNISPWNTAFTTNLDDDQALEIVIIGNRTLYAMDNNGDVIWVREHPPRAYLGFVGDVDGDGKGEIFLGIKGTNKSQARLDIYNFVGEIIKKLIIDGYDTGIPGHRRDGYYDGQPVVSAVKDLNGDGREELYVEMHASYDLYPRGLVCMDYQTGETLWSFIEASHITNIIFPDLDGDGKREIVFGTSASKNGAVCPSTHTTDFSSYVFALSSEGRELWRYEIGRGFYHTMVSSADLNKDGKMEVICYLGDKVPAERTDFGRLLILSPTGKKITEHSTPYLWLKPAGLYDMDSDGYLDAVVQAQCVGEELDHLLIMNLTSGEIEKDATVPMTEGLDITFVPGGINDINGDGRMEIIVSPMLDSTVFVFDSDLKLLWSYHGGDSPGMAIVSDVIPGGVNEILLTGTKMTLLSLDVDVEIERASPMDETIYVLEGDNVNFQVKIKNTGNVTWILEVSLLQQINDEVSYLKSRFIKTPPPGGADTISFAWRAPGNYENITVYLQINLTYYSEGIEHIRERVTWNVKIITKRALANFITLKVEAPGNVVVGKKFTVNGSYRWNQEWEGWEKDKVRSIFSPAVLTISFYGENSTFHIDPGDLFQKTLTSPPQPGRYPLNITLTFRRLGGISEIKVINVVTPTILRRNTGAIALLPGALAIIGAAYLGRHLIKRRFTPPFLPLYRRDYEHPIKDHTMREKIYSVIKKNPGITPAEICRQLGIK
ncbi:MAG: VCBS repeat-containing protein, partial [Thermoplasmata archaeon]|nr:VCBS repeat-containing protein [Thermoplasmata archaeon]